MRLRSFIVAYGLVLAILLFADRRPHPSSRADQYSHVVDLTENTPGSQVSTSMVRTQIVAPGELIPGTWSAGEIPPERLIAPLVVMDLNVSIPEQISLDDIAAWESKHGAIPQGSVVAIRRSPNAGASDELPISSEGARFLMDARYATGFAIENRPDVAADRTLAREIALHGNYVIENAAHLKVLPSTGSLIIVAPAKGQRGPGEQVRVLAMVP